MYSILFILAPPLAALMIPPKPFWPYFAGAVVLIIGFVRILRSKETPARGIERALVFGPLFFAVPVAVFGGDHLMSPEIVATFVPSWIPGHLFWVYFVAVALFAASLSLVTKKHSLLAATLLSAMLFSFVLVIHLPNWVTHPRVVGPFDGLRLT